MASEASSSEPTRLRPAGLAGLAATVTLLGAIGVLPRWPGLPHAVALPPLDVVTDLGVLLVHASSWPWFLAGAAASVAVRAAVMAMLLGGLSRQRFLFAVRFYAVCLPAALLAAVGLYASTALLFYALFWFGVVVALGLVVLTAAAPWASPPRLWTSFARSARAGFRAGTVGAYLLGLTAVGVVADVGGELGALSTVPVSAALTYATAQALRRDPGWRAVRRGAATVAALGVVALAVVAWMGPSAPVDGRVGPPQEGSVMLMSGVDSSSGNGAILEIDPRTMGWTCDRTFYFSYAGPGDGQPRRAAQCDIRHGAPYGTEDTLRSRNELVPFLERQTAEMAPPGVVAGHSQAVWMLWEAAAESRLPGVAAIVLVGAFTENQVAYPPSGQAAPGRVGRDLLGVITVAPRPGGTTTFHPDSPLGREWLGHPDAIERTLARPLPDGIRALGVSSVFDLPLMDDHRIAGAEDACPVAVIHPHLPYAPEFQDAVARFARGAEQPGCPAWRTWTGPLFRHFAVPPSD